MCGKNDPAHAASPHGKGEEDKGGESLMKITRRSVTAGMAALGAAGCLGTARAEDTSQLYEAAKKEGQLTWYSGILNQPICDTVGQAFSKKYPGIRVNAIKTT